MMALDENAKVRFFVTPHNSPTIYHLLTSEVVNDAGSSGHII